MAKYYGDIGFAHSKETAPGVWTDEITIRKYYGDVIRINRRLQAPQETLKDNISITNEISIVADAYAYDNYYAIRYCEWMGAKWKVANVTVQHPRLQLQLGGLYHDE